MPQADANGQRLYYEVHGNGDPLLCVMGLGTDHLGWLPQLRDFSAAYRTVVFDNRDVGQSSYADGPYEIADMAQDALGLADALELESFHLLGESMGGAISQEMALAAPERIRTLTLAVSYGGFGAWGRSRAVARLGTPETFDFEEFIDEMLMRTLSEELHDKNPEMVAYVKQAMLAHPHPQAPEAFVRQAEASGRHETRDRLAQLDMPVHVIGAEFDFMVPVWKSKELADLIPGAKLTIVERAPHAVNIERADEFNRAVLDFIAAAQPARA